MRTSVSRSLIRAVATKTAATTALLAATLFASNAAASPAWADVTYSPLYWELLHRYASVESDWAPIRGVYGSNPECLLALQQGAIGGCTDSIVILNPDGTLGTSGWVEDPAALNGWRPTDCGTIAWDDIDHPNWWLCYG